MKIALIIVGILFCMIGVVALIGALTDRTHRASRAMVYKKTPAELFAIITDHASQASWREGVTKVEILEPRNGHPVVREITSMGPIPLEITESVAPTRYVTKIADESLPFGGQWTFELKPSFGGTELRITEDGEVKNVIFRFIGRYVFGHTKTMEGYLGSLAKKLGEPVAIRD